MLSRTNKRGRVGISHQDMVSVLLKEFGDAGLTLGEASQMASSDKELLLFCGYIVGSKEDYTEYLDEMLRLGEEAR